MMKIINKIFCFLLFIFISCTQKAIDFTDNNETALVKTYGSYDSFDLATWNLQQFPLDLDNTLKYLPEIIRDMDIDLFAIQEIKEESFFFQLLDSLEVYQGELSLSDIYLKLGIIYKKDFISITNKKELFLTSYDTMPRPPLFCYAEVKRNGITVFDFSLIIIHLKAYGGEENILKRKAAVKKLKYFIDIQLLPSKDQDVIILGDWNDTLNAPEEDNIFNIFLEDSLHYEILTKSLMNRYSYIGTDSTYNSLLDHIIITAGVKKEYGQGWIDVLYLDQEFPNYSDYISDHRPVLTRFMGVF
jgi:endonuclease/exonuclease/phosphatase family metal-dependent hydrolase